MKSLAVIVCILIALLPGAANAARRALVIGINDYVNVPRLEKAVGDAQAMAAKLETLGFTVSRVFNPDRRTLNQKISEFQRLVKPGDDVLVHFSGHGVEVAGNNLLLPADVPMPGADDEDFLVTEAISLVDLMQRIAATHAAAKVFVIDACRNNPFAAEGRRGIGGARGLAATPLKGSFVLYSAGDGQEALDKLRPGDTSPTSVYTRVLLETLGRQGMSLTDIAKSVRTKVAAMATEVKHAQDPAYYDGLSGDFFFVEGDKAVIDPPPPPPDTVRQDYEAAKELNTVEAWTAFLNYYTTGLYPDLARVALAKLNRESDQASIPPIKPTPPVKELQPPPVEPDETQRLSLATYEDLDFYGADLSKERVEDVAQCAANCLQENRCVAFTFNANPKFTKGPNCFLKAGTGRLVPYQYAISGIFFDPDSERAPLLQVPAIDQNLPGQDILGHDLFDEALPGVTKLSTCSDACLQDGRCMAFSFAEKVRQCWLKSTDGPLTFNARVTSGVKTTVGMSPAGVYPISE